MGSFHKNIAIFILFFLALHSASAATLSGTVYDNNLDAITDAILTIDTVPKQQYVAKDSTYTFILSPGDYVLTILYENAHGFQVTSSENVSIEKEGDFTYDIIVFTEPGLDEAPPFDEEADNNDMTLIEDTFQPKKAFSSAYLFLIIALIVIIAILVYIIFYRKKGEKKGKNQVQKQAEDLLQDDSKEVLAYIRSQGGRVTQKQLRQHFPFSEAKVSLIVSELEHKGSLEKIKKGKGNIIILRH